MQTELDCVSCLIGQAVDAVKVATDDAELRQATLQAVMAEAATIDYATPPPQMAGRIHRVIREVTGNRDPYRLIKERSNRAAEQLLPELQRRVDRADDPFATAVRIAIAGNVIDFAICKAGEEPDIAAAVDAALGDLFAVDDIAGLRRGEKKAGSILYLVDNAGEIVFDRLLLDQLSTDRVTVAAKAGPIINDATVDDVQAVGIGERFPVVSTGSDYPGTILSTCSESFGERFARADLVIAKGQANYETLRGEPAAAGKTFFLFRVKCPAVAQERGLALGDWVALAG